MILIIDDNSLVADWIKSVGNEIGENCDIAFDGESAVILSAQTVYNVIILDLFMPGLSGVETALKVRQLPSPYGDVPIIVLTGDVKNEEIERWAECRFAAVMIKPVSVADLTANIKLHRRQSDTQPKAD